MRSMLLRSNIVTERETADALLRADAYLINAADSDETEKGRLRDVRGEGAHGPGDAHQVARLARDGLGRVRPRGRREFHVGRCGDQVGIPERRATPKLEWGGCLFTRHESGLETMASETPLSNFAGNHAPSASRRA